MTIYLDAAMLLNGMVDYFLLLGTGQLMGDAPAWRHMLLPAALGGVYGAACLLPGFSFLNNGLWKLISLLLMGFLAFGMRRGWFPRLCLFLFLTFAMGGLGAALEQKNLWGLLCCGGALCGLCKLGFLRSPGSCRMEKLLLEYGDKCLATRGLVDTGNTLNDPITGERVWVAAPTVAEKLLGISKEELQNPLELVTRHPGMRLIPYHAVGKTGGLLPALRVAAEGAGDRRQVLLAFAPQDLGADYELLLGGLVS